jgi:1-acyl-sn-glycerol-3-phosphate acyltransferase
VFRTVGAIPIAPAHEDAALLEQSYGAIATKLRNGEVVCIFPEGKLTHDGEINAFKRGVLRVIQETPSPVVPMALRGLWGSVFSRDGGSTSNRPFSRPFRRGILNRLELVAGAPLDPATVTPEELQQRVGELRGAWR